MYIFTGTEGPKKIIIWNTDIQSKFVKDWTKMKQWYTIFNNILRLTDKTAKANIQDIINEFLNPMWIIGLVYNKLEYGNLPSSTISKYWQP